jgi:hypothetical protein
VVLECEHYGPSKGRGSWGDGSGFLQAVEDYHASYASIHWWPHEFLEANRELVRQINRRIGYRFLSASVAWTDELPLDGRFAASWQWRNNGVAPPCRSLFPAITLKDSAGGVVAVFVDEKLDLRELPVRAAGAAESRQGGFEQALPFQIKGGVFDVFLSVGDRLGKPIVALPLADDDGSRRYRLGTCAVVGDYAVDLVSSRVEGKRIHLQLKWRPHHPLPAGATPFLHLDQGGRIALSQGVPDGTDLTDLRAGREQTTTHVLAIPDGTDGPLRLLVGLWCPDRIGRQDERLRPDLGLGDSRVGLGQVTVTDGTWRITSGQEDGGR